MTVRCTKMVAWLLYDVLTMTDGVELEIKMSHAMQACWDMSLVDLG